MKFLLDRRCQATIHAESQLMSSRHLTCEQYRLLKESFRQLIRHKEVVAASFGLGWMTERIVSGKKSSLRRSLFSLLVFLR